jgi:hypothetical protein
MKLRLSAFVLLVLCSCAGPIINPEMPSVDAYQREFNNDVRWGRWQEAAAQVDPERRSAFLKLLDDSDRPYRFTSVEVMNSKPLSGDGTEMELLVALEYYRLPSVQERRVRQIQTWRFDVLLSKWVVTPDLSVLGEDVSSDAPR